MRGTLPAPPPSGTGVRSSKASTGRAAQLAAARRPFSGITPDRLTRTPPNPIARFAGPPKR
ncbi:hypothetical protein OG211_11290 [Streptomyces niveus]|uniref:hypothetical protein n=1 Tax=Streptomyces niveus TaxID=193462 RepID=UPI00386E798C|nr:hypothetical protein OG211_11290 [Streptomyces niveus]